MVTSSGLPVANGITTVPPNAIKVSISADGIVSAPPCRATLAPQQLGNIAMSSFVNPAGLEPGGQNMHKESAASGQPQQKGRPAPTAWALSKRLLEASNVNVVEELVTMIQTQRALRDEPVPFPPATRCWPSCRSSKPRLFMSVFALHTMRPMRRSWLTPAPPWLWCCWHAAAPASTQRSGGSAAHCAAAPAMPPGARPCHRQPFTARRATARRWPIRARAWWATSSPSAFPKSPGQPELVLQRQLQKRCGRRHHGPAPVGGNLADCTKTRCRNHQRL